jgi:hypothetical protein
MIKEGFFMTTLRVRYNTIFQSVDKDDKNIVQLLDTFNKYQLDFSEIDLATLAAQEIEDDEIVYSYSN